MQQSSGARSIKPFYRSRHFFGLPTKRELRVFSCWDEKHGQNPNNKTLTGQLSIRSRVANITQPTGILGTHAVCDECRSRKAISPSNGYIVPTKPCFRGYADSERLSSFWKCKLPINGKVDPGGGRKLQSYFESKLIYQVRPIPTTKIPTTTATSTFRAAL